MRRFGQVDVGPIPEIMDSLRAVRGVRVMCGRWTSRWANRVRWLTAFAVLGCIALRPAGAQDTLRTTPDSSANDPRTALPERPTVATHAYTVAPAYVEVEAGAQVAAPSDQRIVLVPVLVKIGLAPSVQLDIAPGYARARDHDVVTSGMTDWSFGAKWHALNDVSVLGDFAVQAVLSVPTAPTRTVGTGTTGVSLLGISSHQWNGYELDVNAGITARTGNGSRAPTFATMWTGSLAVPLTARLGAAVELFGYPGTSGNAGAPPAVGFLIGPTYAVTRWLVLDAGAMFNVSHQNGNSVYAGLTWNLGRL